MIPILIGLVVVETMLIVILSACCRVMARDQGRLIREIEELWAERERRAA